MHACSGLASYPGSNYAPGYEASSGQLAIGDLCRPRVGITAPAH